MQLQQWSAEKSLCISRLVQSTAVPMSQDLHDQLQQALQQIDTVLLGGTPGPTFSGLPVGQGPS